MDSFTTVNANALTGGGVNALDIVSKNALKTGDRALVANGGMFYYFIYDEDRDDAENIEIHPFIVRPDNFTTAGVWVECVTAGVGGLSLGETETTAYRGDRGKSAYDHAQLTTGNPHGLSAGDISAEPAFVNLPIAKGGTNNDTFTTDTLLYYDGSKIASTKQPILKFESIGSVYEPGFGVGVPLSLRPGFLPMVGSYVKGHENWGNFTNPKGGIAVYLPPFWYKIDPTISPLPIIKDYDSYASEALANADGFTMPEGFFQGSNIRGIYFDKYKNSKIADGAGFSPDSVKNGLPLSTDAAHNPISALTASGGVNQYYVSLDVVKARDGVDGAKNASSIWFIPSMQQYAVLKLLSKAIPKDAQYCAWRSNTKHYPLGCNNNALADETDTSVLYISDGYSNCGKTGSANQLAKTTHNGQACGIADINGLMYEVATGFTCVGGTKSITAASKANPCQVTTSANHGLVDGDTIIISGCVGMTQLNDKCYVVTRLDDTNFTVGVDSSGYGTWTSGGTVHYGTFYVKKKAFDPTLFTSGTSLATDQWGATGVANHSDNIVIPFPATGGSVAQRFGNAANQVLDATVNSRLTSMGFPKDTNAISSGGTDEFGKDYYYLWKYNQCCPLLFRDWGSGSYAGVWCVDLHYSRGASYVFVGFRACCFGL